MPLSLSNVHDVVTYHAPTSEQIESISKIRAATENLLTVILTEAPVCADTTAATRKVREAMMTANAAIVLNGQV